MPASLIRSVGLPARFALIAGLCAVLLPVASAVEETLVVASATTSRSTSADYVCDGLADDAQIQQAIDALPTSGGSVYLTDGTFSLSNYINLGTRTNIKLYGSGPGTILMIANGANVSAVRGLGCSNITLCDFAIDGNNANNTGGSKGLQFLTAASAGFKFERLHIHNTRDAAIGLTGDNATMMNCEIYDCGGGIQINSGAEKVTVIGCRIYNIGLLSGQLSDAISCQGARCRFESNAIWNNSDTGINIASATGEGRNVAIGNEVFLNGNSGINTGGADHDIIIGNICYANGRKTATPRSNAGIYVRDRTDGTQSSDGVVVIGNRCFDDTATYPLPAGAAGQLYGIALHDDTGANPSNIIATGNILTGNLTRAINREDVGAGVVLQNNLGDTTYNQGIATVSGAATSVTITHGLSVTPTAASISVTPTSSLGSATTFWISNVTSTQFTINLNAAPGTNQTFAWQAHVYLEPTTP